jgi:hypothetical protein
MKRNILKAGKLIRADIDTDKDSDGRIKYLKLSGDFFMHPEDTLEKIENALIECPMNEEDIIKKVKTATKSSQMIGITTDDIAKVILK